MALYFSKCCETKKLIKDCVKVYMINDVATMENKRSMWMQNTHPSWCILSVNSILTEISLI